MPVAGVQKFSVPLSPSATAGAWTLGVEVDNTLFSYTLNVSLARGSGDPLTPDLVIAEEHFVELRFAPEMRRRYKPGLPFVGKVSVALYQKIHVLVSSSLLWNFVGRTFNEIIILYL